MNTQTVQGTITNITRLVNSYNGNPNFNLTLRTDTGHKIVVGTLNDAMVNSNLGDWWLAREVCLNLKVNKYSSKLLSIMPAQFDD
jgi:L-arabinose isomerase